MIRLVTLLAVLATASLSRAATPEEIVAAAKAEGLPADMLEAKWREARLKHAPEAATEAALDKLHGALREADAMVPGGPEALRAEAVRRAGQALASGVPKDALREALVPAKDLPTVARAAQAMAALHAARVPAPAASALVAQTVRAGLGERLLTLRPAVELLEATGIGADEAARSLASDTARGVPPLEAAGERSKEARREGQGNGSQGSASGSSGAGAGSATPDRDRGAGRGAGGAGNNGNGNGNSGDHGNGHGKP